MSRVTIYNDVDVRTVTGATATTVASVTVLLATVSTEFVADTTVSPLGAALSGGTVATTTVSGDGLRSGSRAVLLTSITAEVVSDATVTILGTAEAGSTVTTTTASATVAR